MRVIDWLHLTPTDTDIEALVHENNQTVHIRLLVRQLVCCCLEAYPWQGRTDLIPIFDPSQIHSMGEVVALPLVDEQGVRPDSWRVGRVKAVEVGANTLQGKFQVVCVSVDGKEHWLAAGIEKGGSPPLRFPPSADELDMLVDDIVNHYLSQLTEVIDNLIANKELSALRQGEQLLFGKVPEIRTDFAPLFDDLSAQHPFLTLDGLMVRLQEIGEMADTSTEMARVLVGKKLTEDGFIDAGGGRWTTPARLAELDRKISRRLEVPRMRSKIKAQFGEMEELDTDDFADIPEPGRALLRKFDIEIEDAPGTPEEEWKPPAGPTRLPTLSYLNLMQGYFQLSKMACGAFPTGAGPLIVDMQIVEGESAPFLMNPQERTLKAIDPALLYQRFITELSIPAGTFLWLEYQGENRYRLAAEALGAARPVRCKQAWLVDGLLRVEEVEIEMRYQGDEHLFKSEMRFEDLDALFREAQESGGSIFDAIYDVLPKLAALRVDGQVHYSDVFNAVFFEYRMCSYHTVVHELYDHACFVEAGDGYFRFAPELGVRRRRPTRQQQADAFWREAPGQRAGKTPVARVEPEFWRQISLAIPRKLQTLDAHKPFEITSVTHEAIELIVSTGEPRSLPRVEVEQAWNELNKSGTLGREKVTEFANFNVAYVMAILAQLPGVRYRIRPLQLTIDHAPEAGPQPTDGERETAPRAQPPEERGPRNLPAYLWAALTPESLAYLQKMSARYFGPENANWRNGVLYLRAMAYKKIRGLLEKDRLPSLSLQTFTEQIWEQGVSVAVLSFQLTFKNGPVTDWESFYDWSKIRGNQTWNSRHVAYASMWVQTDSEKEEPMRDALMHLLHADEPVESRLEEVLRVSNGFGMTSSTCILQIMFPQEQVLYAEHSIAALHRIGIAWPRALHNNVRAYVRYRDFCLALVQHLGFADLTDVDNFMQGLAAGDRPFADEQGEDLSPSTEAVEVFPIDPQRAAAPVVRTRSGQLIASDLLPTEPLFTPREETQAEGAPSPVISPAPDEAPAQVPADQIPADDGPPPIGS
jgi:hypothetical protein